ncbi:MAG: BatD family protein [Bdellovibrionales bacterium]
MKKIGKLSVLFFFVLLFFLDVYAEVEIQSSFSQNQVAVGDTVSFNIVVTSDSQVSVEPPRLPNLEDFDLLNSNVSRKTNSLFSQGKFSVQHSMNYSYLLTPKRPGTAKMGPVEIVVNGQPRLTRPQTIEVVQGSGRLAQPRQRNRPQLQDPFEDSQDDELDLFNQLLRRRGLPGIGGSDLPENAEDFFIHVEVNKKNVFVGEPLVASWYLYTAVNLTEIDTLKYPNLNGFWKEDIEVATRLNFQGGHIVNGVEYRRALLASYALFPIKPGGIKIDAYRAKCTLAPLGFWGRGQAKVVTKQSKEIPITVKPLPAQGKPANFTGAVGDFNVSATLKSKQFRVNSPISYEIVFEGTGNAKRIDLPDLQLPEGLELYDTISESKFYKSGKSFKKFELLLVPRFAGAMKIPELKFSMFDPQSAKYYEKSVAPRDINVLPGDGNQTIASTPLDAGGPEAGVPAQAALPGLMLNWNQGSSMYMANRFTFWAFVFCMALLILVWRLFVEMNWLNRSAGLQEELKRRFQQLSSFAAAGDFRKVGIEGSNLIYFILGEISGEGGAHGEIDRLLELSPPIVRQEVGPELKKQLAYFELLGFAPEGVIGDQKDPKEIKRRLKEVDALLSKSIKVSNALFTTKPVTEV